MEYSCEDHPEFPTDKSSIEVLTPASVQAGIDYLYGIGAHSQAKILQYLASYPETPVRRRVLANEIANNTTYAVFTKSTAALSKRFKSDVHGFFVTLEIIDHVCYLTLHVTEPDKQWDKGQQQREPIHLPEPIQLFSSYPPCIASGLRFLLRKKAQKQIEILQSLAMHPGKEYTIQSLAAELDRSADTPFAHSLRKLVEAFSDPESDGFWIEKNEDQSPYTYCLYIVDSEKRNPNKMLAGTLNPSMSDAHDAARRKEEKVDELEQAIAEAERSIARIRSKIDTNDQALELIEPAIADGRAQLESAVHRRGERTQQLIGETEVLIREVLLSSMTAVDQAIAGVLASIAATRTKMDENDERLSHVDIELRDKSAQLQSAAHRSEEHARQLDSARDSLLELEVDIASAIDQICTQDAQVAALVQHLNSLYQARNDDPVQQRKAEIKARRLVHALKIIETYQWLLSTDPNPVIWNSIKRPDLDELRAELG